MRLLEKLIHDGRVARRLYEVNVAKLEDIAREQLRAAAPLLFALADEAGKPVVTAGDCYTEPLGAVTWQLLHNEVVIAKITQFVEGSTAGKTTLGIGDDGEITNWTDPNSESQAARALAQVAERVDAERARDLSGAEAVAVCKRV